MSHLPSLSPFLPTYLPPSRPTSPLTCLPALTPPRSLLISIADGREILHLVEVYDTSWGKVNIMAHPVALACGGAILLVGATLMGRLVGLI
jgi:hypothetical protein